MTMYDMPTSDSLTHCVKSPRARPQERRDGRGRRDHDTGCWQPLDLRSNGRIAKLLKICRITLQDRVFTHRSRITPCNRSISDPRALGSPYHGRMESHYPTICTLAVRSYSSPHVLQYYGGLLLVVTSIHITTVPLILTLLPNPWRPKFPRSAVSTRLEPSRAMSSTSSTPVLPQR